MLSVMGTFAHYGGGWGPGFIGPVVGLLFWALLVTALVFWFRRGPGRHHLGHSGEAVLGERYARGEISEQEYRERRAVLRDRR